MDNFGVPALRNQFGFETATDVTDKGRKQAAENAQERSERLAKIAAAYDRMEQRRTNSVLNSLKIQEANSKLNAGQNQAKVEDDARKKASEHIKKIREAQKDLEKALKLGVPQAEAFLLQVKRFANDPDYSMAYENLPDKVAMRASRDTAIENLENLFNQTKTRNKERNDLLDMEDGIQALIDSGTSDPMLSGIMARVAERRKSGDMDMYKRSLNRAKNFVTSEVKTIEANVKKVDELRQLAANPKVFKRTSSIPSLDATVDRVENFDPIYAKNLFDTYMRLLKPSRDELDSILATAEMSGPEATRDADMKAQLPLVEDAQGNYTNEVDFEAVRRLIADKKEDKVFRMFDAYVAALADAVNTQANEEEDRLIDSQRALGLAIGMDLDFDPEASERRDAGSIISGKTGS